MTQVTFGQNKPWSFGSSNSTSPTVKFEFGNATSTFPAFSQRPTTSFTITFEQPNNFFGGSSFGTRPLFGASKQSIDIKVTVPNGSAIKFEPVSGNDFVIKNGRQKPVSTLNFCITAMEQYESKSLEELRMEDYAANRKGHQEINITISYNETPPPPPPVFCYGSNQPSYLSTLDKLKGKRDNPWLSKSTQPQNGFFPRNNGFHLGQSNSLFGSNAAKNDVFTFSSSPSSQTQKKSLFGQTNQSTSINFGQAQTHGTLSSLFGAPKTFGSSNSSTTSADKSTTACESASENTFFFGTQEKNDNASKPTFSFGCSDFKTAPVKQITFGSQNNLSSGTVVRKQSDAPSKSTSCGSLFGSLKTFPSFGTSNSTTIPEKQSTSLNEKASLFEFNSEKNTNTDSKPTFSFVLPNSTASSLKQLNIGTGKTLPFQNVTQKQSDTASKTNIPFACPPSSSKNSSQFCFSNPTTSAASSVVKEQHSDDENKSTSGTDDASQSNSEPKSGKTNEITKEVNKLNF